MIAPIHKNTNVSLILVFCDVMICMLEKHIISYFSGFFEGTQDFLDPQLVSISPTVILFRTVHISDITREYKPKCFATYIGRQPARTSCAMY
jgi:hypothetical protein